ncbi:MAG: NAD(P)H-hydrate dehydratase [Zoogloeaceae bacterium]|jgi:hydroxyethylthiazole kinase-like uncharacterized protein yjeF|nr:NAD(P)H-hydrate dehydratase [Zoogloeaceae bacterium]
MNITALFFSKSLRRIEAAHGTEGLMGYAGAAAAEFARQLLERNAPVLVLVGPGNNGGDALVMARHLRERRVEVCVIMIANPATLPEEAAQAYRDFTAAGGVTHATIPLDCAWGLIVDGLFGIGLARALEHGYAKLVEAANALADEYRCPVLALDVPSGLNADTGLAARPTIHASHTLTFLRAKPGLFTADGPDYCGEIQICDLGLTDGETGAPDGNLVSRKSFARCLVPRRRNSHKGNYGTVGIIGGARSMMGAVILAGRAAIKLGAGRVLLSFLDDRAPQVEFEQPELILRNPETMFEAGLNALVCGPGLGRSLQAAELLERTLATPVPLVLDADALNILAFEEGMQTRVAMHPAPVILTPHPAEAGRLLDLQTENIQQNRVQIALELAQRFQAWVTLKGCGSVIATPEGDWWINPTGNPGLSSAGSGDVLTGIVAALVGQGWPPTEALLAACHLHGQAADDLAAAGIGPVGLCAGELADAARSRFNRWLAGN